jgi:hypothetical protein
VRQTDIDPLTLRIESYIYGDRCQDLPAVTGLAFNPHEIVAAVSRIMTLPPGDPAELGTPGIWIAGQQRRLTATIGAAPVAWVASLTDGGLLAAKMGQSVSATTTVFRSPPIFDTRKGVVRMPAEKFVDDESRVIAWQKLEPRIGSDGGARHEASGR